MNYNLLIFKTKPRIISRLYGLKYQRIFLMKVSVVYLTRYQPYRFYVALKHKSFNYIQEFYYTLFVMYDVVLHVSLLWNAQRN
jgi:hypothetical protein